MGSRCSVTLRSLVSPPSASEMAMRSAFFRSRICASYILLRWNSSSKCSCSFSSNYWSILMNDCKSRLFQDDVFSFKRAMALARLGPCPSIRYITRVSHWAFRGTEMWTYFGGMPKESKRALTSFASFGLFFFFLHSTIPFFFFHSYVGVLLQYRGLPIFLSLVAA